MTNKKNCCIVCYKHDEKIHRVWENVKILEENDEYIIAANDKTKVIESNGKVWTTKEPAICYFFKKYWFNVIGMLKKDGINYYCNLSSPAIYDGEAIKYIDYDLDVKVFSNGHIKLLDENEYNIHKKQMKYPKEIMDIVESTQEFLLDYIKDKKEPFAPGFIEHWYKIYKEL